MHVRKVFFSQGLFTKKNTNSSEIFSKNPDIDIPFRAGSVQLRFLAVRGQRVKSGKVVSLVLQKMTFTFVRS